MQTRPTRTSLRRAGLQAALLLAALTSSLALAAFAPPAGAPRVLPPGSSIYGHTYAEWSARLWQWALSLPLTSPGASAPDHPFLDSPGYHVTEGQRGPVWFLAAPVPGTVTRTVTIPQGKSLCFSLLAFEASDLEGYGSTEAEQLAVASYFADHFVNLFCSVDGNPVTNPDDFRVASSQFKFNAPSPWIFGDTGGHGTGVSDGQFVIVTDLSLGPHTLHYGGEVLFTMAEDGFDLSLPLDMTYQITVSVIENDQGENGN